MFVCFAHLAGGLGDAGLDFVRENPQPNAVHHGPQLPVLAVGADERGLALGQLLLQPVRLFPQEDLLQAKGGKGGGIVTLFPCEDRR